MMRIAELVYDSLNGDLIDPVEGVPNAFEQGSFCEHRYGEMLKAYERVRDRLGVTDEDEDVEIMIGSLLDIQKKLCLKMFELGRTIV